MSDRPIAFEGDGFEIIAHASPATLYPEETHTTIQTCVPMPGAHYRVRRETETGATLDQDLGARDILLVPTGQPHEVHWLQPAGIVSLHLSEGFVEETLDVPRLRLPDSLAIADQFVSDAAAEFYSAIRPGEPISRIIAEALAIGVAHRIATIASPGGVRTSVAVRRITPTMLRIIERYVDRNLERQIGLAELATLAGLSRWYFLRLFQETVGASPHDYITRRRLDRAKRLLSHTSRTIMEIAGDVGMTHSHFSRVFLRRIGITPSEFRRRSR